MAVRTTLSGSTVLGGGEIVFAATIGSGRPTFRGETVEAVNFGSMVRSLLGDYLKIPADFPDVVFQRLVADIVPGDSLVVDASSNVAWSAPFGILKGFSFADLGLYFSTGQNGTSIAFSAAVSYGGARLAGQLVFADGRLMVAGTEMDALDIVDLLARSVPGVSWGDLLAIRLLPQPPSDRFRIYYAASDFDTYRAGFNLDRTRIEVLTYGATVSLQVEDGVTVTGSLDTPIDLGFLRLSAPDFSPSSPTISISTRGGGSARLDAGVSFLDQRFGRVAVSIEPRPAQGGHQLAATLSHQGRIGPFQDPTFAFTWSPAGGFRVDRWSIPNFPATEVIDVVALLNRLSGQACAAFVSAMFKELIETSFDFTASMGSPGDDGAAAGALTVTASGTYSVGLRDSADRITVALPVDLVVSLTKPEEFSFESLADSLLRAIADAAESIVRQLVQDPARSAKFFALVAAPASLPRLIAAVACRGWGSPPPPPPPPPPPFPVPPIPPFPPFLPPPPEGPSGSPGLVAVTGLSADDGGITVGFDAAPGASWYVGVLRFGDDPTPLLETRISRSPGLIPFDETRPAGPYGLNLQARNAVGYGPWSDLQSMTRLAPTTTPTLEHAPPNLSARWTASPDAGGYEYLVVDPTGAVFATGTTRANVTEAARPLPSTAPEGIYQAVVRALPSSSGPSSSGPSTSAGAAHSLVLASQWSAPGALVVDPGAAPGWVVSVRNDLPPTTDPITAVVLAPPVGDPFTIPSGQTLPLGGVPIVGFAVWHDLAREGPCRAIAAAQIAISTSGPLKTLTYLEITRGALPDGFRATARRGVTTGPGTTPMWADQCPPQVIANALWGLLGVPVPTARLLVLAYPDLSQPALASCLAPLGLEAAALCTTLLGVRDHYVPPLPQVTPVSVAVSVAQALASLGTPLDPLRAAGALLNSFAEIGEPLDALALATALTAAFPPTAISVDALVPIVTALASSFSLVPTAVAVRASVTVITPAVLAGAPKRVFLGETPSIDDYARQLRKQALAAPAAAAVLVGQFGFVPASALAQALVAAFADTTDTPFLLSWCLSAAAVAASATARAVLETLPAVAATPLAAALKTTYPARVVRHTVGGLQAVDATAATAAATLTRTFADLTAVQVGWLLLVYFSATAPDARAMTVALAPLWPMAAAAVALRSMFPTLSAAEIAAILKSAYQTGGP